MSLSTTPVISQQYSDFHCPSTDILRGICSFLDTPQDIVHFGLANRRLSILLSDMELWNSLLHKHFPSSHANLKLKIESLALYKRLTSIGLNMKADHYRIQTFYHSRVYSITIYGDKLISLGGRRIKIWNLAGFELLMSAESPDSATCMTIWGNKFIFGTGDGTIRILDFLTEKEQTLIGHLHTITHMMIWDDKLISGSSDGVMRIWDLHTGQIQRLIGHQHSITSMTIWNGKLISGSRDGTIKIWDLNSAQELRTLIGHCEEIHCLTVGGCKLISCSRDDTIKIWDLNSGQELQMLKEKEYASDVMAIQGDRLISRSKDYSVKVWDLNSGQRLWVLGREIAIMMVWGDKLITGSFDDHMIEIWDLNSGRRLQTLHEGPINLIKVVDDGAFITVSNDMIKIWNFNTIHNH